MTIFNKTSKKTIIKKTKICKSLFCKSFGLMFRKKPDYGLVFVFSNEKRLERTLTMLFVFYPIDVLFLNSRKQVVDKKEGFMPFTNYTPKKAAQYVIELPAKVSSAVKIGDRVEWQ